MDVPREEIERALAYADELKITAEVDPADRKTVVFKREPPIPTDLPPDIVEILDICIEYHQRCVFTGEYLDQDENRPICAAGNALEEINFHLDHYKNEFVKEVRKGLEVDQDVSETPPSKLTPYAEIMLKMKQRQKRDS